MTAAPEIGAARPLVPWHRDIPPGEVEPLRTTPFMVGHERKADVVWSQPEFLSLCRHMMNGNEPDFFMLAFRDREEQPRFAKSRKPVVERRASWAWDTVTGRAKSPSGIGFYPRDKEGKTRWAAMDFDAHSGEQEDRDKARRFAIRAPRTRRVQLAGLIGHIFRQIGREVAEVMAAAQFHDANPAPRSDLAEHLRDFCDLWAGRQSAFLAELRAPERRAFDALATENERDAFKILRSFASHAEGKDFPVAVENFGRRMGVTREGAGKMRRKFCGLGILRQTAPAITNKAAARFEWTADRETKV